MAKYKCLINNEEKEIRDGFTIRKEMNETLDSGTFQFLNENGEANIESFDSVVFESVPELHVSRKKMLVDSGDSEIETFKSSLDVSDYFYITTMFSETKYLERITLPDIAITKRPDGTIVTVWDKIKQYCRIYLPRIFVYDSEDEFKKKMRCCFKYDRALEQKFSMECPEMSWQAPTLREVLTDLFYVANCIPVIQDNVLTFMDLNYRGNEINQSKLTNKSQRFTSADYCDELTIPMKNTISKTTTHVEWVTPRTVDSSEMTTDNMCLVTQKPIYKIKSLRVYAGTKQDEGYPPIRVTSLLSQELVRVGRSPYIHDFVVEEEEYNVLNPRRKRIEPTWSSSKGTWSYQAFVLHYKRGSNIIKNVGESIKYNTQGTASVTDSRVSLAYGAARALSFGGTGNPDTVSQYAIDDTNTRKILFRIEYETIDETTLHVGKLTQIKNTNNKLFDGQTAQTVDLSKQTIHEYAKANRLGNKIMTIYGEYIDEREIPQLGDRIGNKILFSSEVTYWDNILFFKGELIDNYILRDYFTGVISKRRSWAIASEQESVNRHDVIKFYVAASFNHQMAKLEQYDIPYFIGGDYGHLVDVFSGTVSSIYKVNGVAANTSGKDGMIPSISEYIIMESNICAVGRSFVCDFGFIDNMVAGYRIQREKDGSTTEFISSIIPYCDSNGECTRYNVRLCNEIRANEDDAEGRIENMISWLSNSTNWGSSEGQRIWDKINDYANKKPLTVTGAFNKAKHMRITQNYLYKDNRETLKTTVQFEFTSDDERIIVTDALASYSSLIFSGDVSLRVYRLSNGHYDPNETVARGTLQTGAQLLFTSNDEKVSTGEQAYQKVTLLGTYVSSTGAWCICDNKDRILIAVNSDIKTVNFEIRLLRDTNVYNSQIDKVAIGKSHQVEELDAAYQQKQPQVSSIKVLNREININDFKDFEGAND